VRSYIVRQKREWLPLVVKHVYKPGRILSVVLGIAVAVPLLNLPRNLENVLVHGIKLAVIASVAHFLIRLIKGAKYLLMTHYDEELVENPQARKVYTQFRIIERIMIFVIIVLAIAIGLMTFDKIRQIGVSLLASAGVIGVIMGLAAQRSLGAVFAGIQIAMSQPIRIEDVVVVEGEWGSIEEITLTYVAIRLWDERRLIVPINYFIEKPFQNWTRSSSEIVGSVIIYADYTLPMDELRNVFEQYLKEDPLWDGRIATLFVTDANAETVQIRATMSATNSNDAFDLRCHIREKLITYIRTHHNTSLPRRRVESFVQPAASVVAKEATAENDQSATHQSNH
jgi:small-conductance mechanosensitive channel